MKGEVFSLYLDLLERYKDPESFWPQWCAKKKDRRSREIVAIGAILTQRTSWTNADLALRNLKEADLLSLKKIANLKNLDGLTRLIKPAGFYQTKPKRLHNLATFITMVYGNIENFRKESMRIAREKLLDLYGIGEETADTLLLYALDKASFVIDEYTKRFVEKYQLTHAKSYSGLKNYFEKLLPRDVKIYQNYHILIIIDSKGEEKSKMKIV